MASAYSTLAITTSMMTLLGACGGSGGSDNDAPPLPQIVTGAFVDAPVEGLRWESNQLSGVTDAAGSFQYREGDAVKFFLGDIFLGESIGFKIIIPVDIVAGAQNIDNPQVLNIARLMLTLDDDANAANGIEITPTVSDLTAGETVNFAVSTDQFTADTQSLVDRLTAATTAGARDLVAAPFAREHLRLTIAQLLAGDYRGTYSGDGEGSWSATVNLNGDLSGTAISANSGAPIQLAQEGAVLGDGSGKAGFGASGGALNDRTVTFTGIFRTDGRVSGSWKDDDLDDAGSWQGNKIQ